jgi:CheY-like chemotaxis protein
MQTVLFADADRELCEIYGGLLASYDYQVEVAGNGVECMTKLRQLLPDLLILDLDLPWSSGDGVLAVMREDPRLALIPVVLTATGPTQALDRLLATRLVVQLLTKPFRLPALLACLPMPVPTKQESTPDGADRQGILVVDDEAAVCKMLE